MLEGSRDGSVWFPRDWINFQIFDEFGAFIAPHLASESRIYANLWPFVDPSCIWSSAGSNYDISSKPKICSIEFDVCPFSVVHSSYFDVPLESELGLLDEFKSNRFISYELNQILSTDPLCPLSSTEKSLVWAARRHIQSERPEALAKLLKAISWTSSRDVAILHQLLRSWPTIPPIYALGLLECPDRRLREFAVSCLQLPDNQLVDLLPQLVQGLKCECHHFSPLSEFLLYRATKSFLLGHRLWWTLFAELSDPSIEVRFKLLMQAYVSASSFSFTTTRYASRAIQTLAEIATALKQSDKPPELLRSDLHLKLAKHLEDFEGRFRLPLHPKFEVEELMIEQCTVMKSKTKPLQLTFKTTFDNTIEFYFKMGDDLRTDVLSLQLFRMMDKWWKADGLDLLLEPYAAINTGAESGMIERVQDAETIAKIQMMRSDGVLMNRVLDSKKGFDSVLWWLSRHNPTPEALQKARYKFILSCAGYCVATYVLGVKDRHNDNYMVTKRGNFFHIDFGKFLGNAETFLGIPRETAPFVLLPEFVVVFGGENSEGFQKFTNTCCSAFQILRRNSNQLLTLMLLMIPAKIPQLERSQQVNYMKEALMLELSEQDSTTRFKELIISSYNNLLGQVNNFFHILLKKNNLTEYGEELAFLYKNAATLVSSVASTIPPSLNQAYAWWSGQHQSSLSNPSNLTEDEFPHGLDPFEPATASESSPTPPTPPTPTKASPPGSQPSLPPSNPSSSSFPHSVPSPSPSPSLAPLVPSTPSTPLTPSPPSTPSTLMSPIRTSPPSYLQKWNDSFSFLGTPTATIIIENNPNQPPPK